MHLWGFSRVLRSSIWRWINLILDEDLFQNILKCINLPIIFDKLIIPEECSTKTRKEIVSAPILWRVSSLLQNNVRNFLPLFVLQLFGFDSLFWWFETAEAISCTRSCILKLTSPYSVTSWNKEQMLLIWTFFSHPFEEQISPCQCRLCLSEVVQDAFPYSFFVPSFLTRSFVSRDGCSLVVIFMFSSQQKNKINKWVFGLSIFGTPTWVVELG